MVVKDRREDIERRVEKDGSLITGTVLGYLVRMDDLRLPFTE